MIITIHKIDSSFLSIKNSVCKAKMEKITMLAFTLEEKVFSSFYFGSEIRDFHIYYFELILLPS